MTQCGPSAIGKSLGSSKGCLTDRLLEMASARHNLNSKWWGTFNQWKDMGGKVMPRPSHVPSGKWGTQIVFWTPVTKTERDEEGDEKTDRYFVMRSYTVFCVDQVEGDHLNRLRAGEPDTN